jgi:hypothetical protein
LSLGFFCFPSLLNLLCVVFLLLQVICSIIVGLQHLSLVFLVFCFAFRFLFCFVSFAFWSIVCYCLLCCKYTFDSMILTCYCYHLDCCVTKKFNRSLFFALFLGFITSTTLSFKLWRINSFKFQHIWNSQMFSLSIFYCLMDGLNNRVLFLIRWIFFILSLDPSFAISTQLLYNWNEYEISSHYNYVPLFSIIQLFPSLVARFRSLGEVEKHHMVLPVFINKIHWNQRDKTF